MSAFSASYETFSFPYCPLRRSCALAPRRGVAVSQDMGANVLKKLKRENKPWAALGLSRREYEAKRPWKAAKMSRDGFEEIVLALPHEIVADMKLHAEAELLVESIFGAAAKD